MIPCLRLPSTVAVSLLVVMTATLNAQTLIVRRAPAGSTVELVVNSAKAGSTQANADGDAVLPIDLGAGVSKNEMDARVFVDTCGQIRRITVAERDAAIPPPEGDCARQEITGLFVIRRVSSVVVDVGEPVATLLLRQGPYSLRPRGPRRLAPDGFVIFGGGSLMTYADAVEFGCAGVPTCSGDDRGNGFTVGGEYWFTRYLSVEGSYIRPPQLTITGSGETYRFDSFLEPHMFTLAGKGAVPLGIFRLYGRAGFNYHRAESGTTQVTQDVTTTVNGVTTTTPGTTQTTEADTRGWGYLFGGGLEVWPVRALGLYVEGGAVGLKGAADRDEQGRIDNRLPTLTLGLRISLGR